MNYNLDVQIYLFFIQPKYKKLINKIFCIDFPTLLVPFHVTTYRILAVGFGSMEIEFSVSQTNNIFIPYNSFHIKIKQISMYENI